MNWESRWDAEEEYLAENCECECEEEISIRNGIRIIVLAIKEKIRKILKG